MPLTLTKTQAIKNFLTALAPADLADLYTHDMECQVNVRQGKGERVDGDYNGHKWTGWSDGVTTWKNFRIPLHANTEPEYSDTNISFDLNEHAEGIGMTGWNWKTRKSYWFAYDFDAIMGHSDKHEQKLTEQQLAEVQEAACQIPWVTVRRSTSGNGLHLYVFVDGVPTANHTEHAALARSILGKMSALTGFDFDSRVDNCGGNIWVWHRKYEKVGGRTGPGLKLIKVGAPLDVVPPNWRDHIKVASGARKRNRPGFVAETEEFSFEEFCGQNQKVPLDAEHRALFDYLDKLGALWWFDNDHHMMVAHTADLKRAHTELSMRGIFETMSKGSETGSDQNCYAFPMRRGGWAVRRHTRGVQEHESWEQDSGGWTKCYLNREPDLRIAARSMGGNEMEQGGYQFQEVEMAVMAAEKLGAITEIPEQLMKVPAILKSHKDGRLVLQVDAPIAPGEKATHYDQQAYSKLMADLTRKGWVQDKKKLKLVFGSKASQQDEEAVDVTNYDDFVRHLVSESGENCGWVCKSDGVWINEPLEHVRAVLLAAGVKNTQLSVIVGALVTRKWTLVNRPFSPEYPGDRCWNRASAQFAFTPSTDIDNLHYPTWLSILNHVGAGLDSSILKDKWCIDNAIKTGGEYLKCWVASLFQFPLQPLPYLFLYGPQGSGKSIFHESISLLMTRGSERADAALISQAGFNAELESKVLCYIEETDLRQNKSQAYNRIKDYVTSLTMSVHRKGRTPYMTQNSSHWVQCANEMENCPVFPGDTRITMCYVDMPAESIPKNELISRLRKEAPDFLAHIINFQIPEANDRLRIPIIITEEKKRAQASQMNEVESFISEHCHVVPGEAVKYGELFNKFIETLEPEQVCHWTKQAFGKQLPIHLPKGRLMSDGAQWYIGNLSFEPKSPTGKRYVHGEAQSLVLEDVK